MIFKTHMKRIGLDKPMLKKMLSYVLILVLEAILIMYSVELCNKISGKETTVYELTKTSYSDLVLSNGNVCNLKFENGKNDLKRIGIKFSSEDVEGMIYYRMLNPIDESEPHGQNIAELEETGILYIDIDSSINDSEVIEILVGSDLTGDITFQVDNQGYAASKMIYRNVLASSIKTIVIISNIVVFLCMLLLINCKKIERRFVLTSMIVGLFSIIVVIPCSAPDEWRHFLRAYDVSQGNWFGHDLVYLWEDTYTTTCEIPSEFLELKNLAETKNEIWTDESNSNISVPTWLAAMHNTDAYSGSTEIAYTFGTGFKGIVEYFPQIVFLLISKCFGLNAFYSFYMARLGNLVFSTIVGYYAIKYSPDLKNFLYVLFFLPLMIFLRCTSSTDGMLYSLILLLISLYSYLLNHSDRLVKQKVMLCLIALTSWIAILKLPYALIIVLLVGIRSQKEIQVFGKNYNLREKYSGIIIMLITLASTLAIYAIVDVVKNAFTAQVLSEGGQSSIAYVSEHLFYSISLFVRTFIDTFLTHFEDAITWQSEKEVIFIYVVIMLYTCFTEKHGKHYDIYKSVACIIAFVLSWFAIIYVAFSWSDYESNSIWGLVGRYMTPLLPLLGVAIMKQHHEYKEESMIVCQTVLFCTNMLFLIGIVSRYW